MTTKWNSDFSSLTFSSLLPHLVESITLEFSSVDGEEKIVALGSGSCLREIYLEDVIGASLDGKELTIFHYPKVEPRCGRSTPPSTVPRPRKSDHVTLIASTTHPSLSLLVDCIRTLSTGTSAQRTFLVVVNPFSGKKRGAQHYESEVLPMFTEANIKCDLLVTNHAGHATERLKEDGGDLSTYDGIIAVGGDGLLYEMMQGIQTRGDKDELLRRVTFGIIPSGSGNGLAASVVHSAGEVDSILANTFVICKNGSKPADLSLYETSAGNRYLSFLSLSWGIVADVDLESEVFRVLGPLRFDVYAIWRMISLKRYSGAFSYLPASTDSASLPTALDMPVPSDWVTMEGKFLCLWALQTTHAAQNMYTSPGSSMNDGVFHVVLLTDKCSRLQLLQSFLAFENGEHLKQKHVQIVKCKAYRLEPTSNNSHVDLDGEEIEYGTIQAHVQQSGMNLYY